MKRATHCEYCGKKGAEPTGNSTPIARMMWCSNECLAAWENEDPKRKEGWVSVSDLSRERLSELFEASGLKLESEKVLS